MCRFTSGYSTNMPEITNLAEVRKHQAKIRQAALLEFANSPVFPGGQYLDQLTDQPTLDDEAETALRKAFDLFGLTEIDPLDTDFEKVVNTWYVLFTVGTSLRSLSLFGIFLHDKQKAVWHPLYTKYIEALWAGDVPRIKSTAKALGIHRGIPEGSPRLSNGPL